jgi:hypothetical protein
MAKRVFGPDLICYLIPKALLCYWAVVNPLVPVFPDSKVYVEDKPEHSLLPHQA